LIPFFEYLCELSSPPPSPPPIFSGFERDRSWRCFFIRTRAAQRSPSIKTLLKPGSSVFALDPYCPMKNLRMPFPLPSCTVRPPSFPSLLVLFFLTTRAPHLRSPFLCCGHRAFFCVPNPESFPTTDSLIQINFPPPLQSSSPPATKSVMFDVPPS